MAKMPVYLLSINKHDNEDHKMLLLEIVGFYSFLFLMRIQKGLGPNNVASQSISCRKILTQCNHDLTNVLSFSFCAEKSFQFRRKLTLNESAQKVVLALVQSYISQVLYFFVFLPVLGLMSDSLTTILVESH